LIAYKYSKSCPAVPLTPHKLGLWIFHISSNPKLNVDCEAVSRLQEAHPRHRLGKYSIKIGGNEYHLPHSCSNFTSYEVSAPSPAVSEQWNATEELPGFIEGNFDGDTEAIVMIGE